MIFTVASVCQKWQMAALQYSSLWSHVVIKPPFYASYLMIRHSGRAILDVHFEIEDDKLPQILEDRISQALKHIRSICSIDDSHLLKYLP